MQLKNSTACITRFRVIFSFNSKHHVLLFKNMEAKTIFKRVFISLPDNEKWKCIILYSFFFVLIGLAENKLHWMNHLKITPTVNQPFAKMSLVISKSGASTNKYKTVATPKLMTKSPRKSCNWNAIFFEF